MTKVNLTTINNIQQNYYKNSFFDLFSKNFKKIERDIKKDLDNNNRTLNILSKNYKFNFNLNDLKRFNKYKTIVIIGMGGSILGAESLYNFFENRIKKKVYFLTI